MTAAPEPGRCHCAHPVAGHDEVHGCTVPHCQCYCLPEESAEPDRDSCP